MPNDPDEIPLDGGAARDIPARIPFKARLVGPLAAAVCLAAVTATPIVVTAVLGYDMSGHPLRFWEYSMLGWALAVEAPNVIVTLFGVSEFFRHTRGSRIRVSAAGEFVGALAGVGAGIGEGMDGRHMLSAGSLLIGLFLFGLSLNKIRKIGLFTDSRGD